MHPSVAIACILFEKGAHTLGEHPANYIQRQTHNLITVF